MLYNFQRAYTQKKCKMEKNLKGLISPYYKAFRTLTWKSSLGQKGLDASSTNTS